MGHTCAMLPASSLVAYNSKRRNRTGSLSMLVDTRPLRFFGTLDEMASHTEEKISCALDVRCSNNASVASSTYERCMSRVEHRHQCSMTASSVMDVSMAQKRSSTAALPAMLCGRHAQSRPTNHTYATACSASTACRRTVVSCVVGPLAVSAWNTLEMLPRILLGGVASSCRGRAWYAREKALASAVSSSRMSASTSASVRGTRSNVIDTSGSNACCAEKGRIVHTSISRRTWQSGNKNACISCMAGSTACTKSVHANKAVSLGACVMPRRTRSAYTAHSSSLNVTSRNTRAKTPSTMI